MTLCGTGIAAEDPIPVELWRRGHDVLRAKFHAAVEDALSSSPDFTLTSKGGRKSGGHSSDPSRMEKTFWRTRIIYTVEFSTKDEQLIGVSQGYCWKSSVKKCAESVLEDARSAAKKIPR